MCEQFAVLPDSLRASVQGRTSEWLARREMPWRPSFLEGPSFDRAGNLYCVDIPWGRVFRISPGGDFSLAAEYDGEPNGLRIHADGRIFIADQKNGIVIFDPETGDVQTCVARAGLDRLNGPNDLIFGRDGSLYFTDQGGSSLSQPTGRVFRLRPDGALDLLLDNLPGPNGIALSPDEHTLYVGITNVNAIWKAAIMPSGNIGKLSVFIQLSGGEGPDGLAVDTDGNLAVVHYGMGTWLFSPLGIPLLFLESGVGRMVTNLAYDDEGTLFITETSSHSIVKVKMPTPGHPLFSHLGKAR